MKRLTADLITGNAGSASLVRPVIDQHDNRVVRHVHVEHIARLRSFGYQEIIGAHGHQWPVPGVDDRGQESPPFGRLLRFAFSRGSN